MGRGFRLIRGVFESGEVEQFCTALAGVELPHSRAGARHLLQNAAVARMARDSRLIDIARDILGREPFPFRATLFAKSPSANWLVVWHQDTTLPLRRRFEAPGWGPWSVKAGILYAHAPANALRQIVALRVHLDDSTSANGPLRVLPGSQIRGVLSDDDIRRLLRDSEAVDCLVPRGGVLAMRPLLVHSSSKAVEPSPRRVLHIEYAQNQQLGPDIELAVA